MLRKCFLLMVMLAVSACGGGGGESPSVGADEDGPVKEQKDQSNWNVY